MDTFFYVIKWKQETFIILKLLPFLHALPPKDHPYLQLLSVLPNFVMIGQNRTQSRKILFKL